MATLSTNGRNAGLDAILALLNGGTLRIGTTGMAQTLVTLNLNVTAFQNASNGVATANSISQATISNSGIATEAALYNSSGTAIITGLTVGVEDTEIIVSSTDFVQNGIASVSSLQISLSA